MFARHAVRSAFPLRNSIRHYASEPPKSGPNQLLYGGFAVAVTAGAYYYLNSSTPKAAAPKSSQEQQNVAAPGASSLAFTGGDQGFISLKLEDVEIINHNTKKFRFALPGEDYVSGLKICSALLTKYQGPGMEKPVIRPYTPTSSEDQKGYIELIIKAYPNGPMPQHLHSMQPNQRLEFKGPIPKFQWSPNKHEQIALIAGGTGITPMYQLARAILSNPEDKTRISLIFGNVSEEDILLKKEWESLENEFPNRLRAFYLLDKPPKEWAGGKGFITKELLKTVLPDPKQGEKIKVFVCGPPPMYNAISGNKKSPSDQGELTGYLKELGYSKDQVYKF